MSDNDSASNGTEPEAAPALLAAAKAQIDALLSDAKKVSTEFLTEVASRKAEIAEAQASVEAAKKTATETIELVTASGEAAKQNLASIKAEVNQAKEDFSAATSGATAEVEKTRSDISALKTQAENSTAEIDKTKTSAATAKGAIETTQKAATTDAANINQAKLEIEKLAAAAKAKTDSLDAEHAAIATQVSSLKDQSKALENVLAEIGNLRDQAATANNSVSSNIETIKSTKETFEALKAQTQEQHDQLVEGREELDGQIKDIEKAHSSIDAFYKLLLEGDGENESIKTEIQALQSKISEVLAETSKQKDLAKEAFDKLQASSEASLASLGEAYSKKFEDLHSELSIEIRSLLPSAGAAGLASTYYDAKSRYAPTTSDRPGRQHTNEQIAWWRWRSIKQMFGYNPASVVATISFYVMFIAPILGIVYIFYGILSHLPGGNIANLDFKILALRVLIALPLATISAFGFSSLRSYRRLFEEYNHKQRVMELYTSFQKEIEKSGTDEQKQRLLTIMLDAVADKSYLATSSPNTEKGGGEIMSQLKSISDAVNNLTKLNASP